MALKLVVEWTRASLRVAVAESRGQKWRLRAVHSQPLSPTTDPADILRGMVKQAGKVAGTPVISVVSREQVITRLVRFPTTAAPELAQMAELYAKGQLPYAREQTVMDYHVLQQQEGFSTVAIVACQRDVVDRQLATLRAAGCTPGLVTVSSWGVLGWLRQQADHPAAARTCLVVNVDDMRTDLALVAEGRLLSSRSIGQGTQDWQASGTNPVELLGAEIERSRSSVRKELPGTEVQMVLLTGLGSLSAWKESLGPATGLPVSVAPAESAWKGAMMRLSVPISPVVVGGLAGAGSEGLLNLSPAEVRGQAQHRRQVQQLVVVGVLLLMVLALGAATLRLRVARQQQAIQQLEAVTAQAGPVARQLQQKQRAAQMIGGLLHEREQAVSLLALVLQQTPAAITLEGLGFERLRHELVLRGRADSTQVVLDYLRQLQQVPGVAGVELKFSTTRATAAGEYTDFELVVRQPGSAA